MAIYSKVSKNKVQNSEIFSWHLKSNPLLANIALKILPCHSSHNDKPLHMNLFSARKELLNGGMKSNYIRESISDSAKSKMV